MPTREEALWVLNEANVPMRYAETGVCPLCGSEKRGGQYPHKPDCEFVQATKVLQSPAIETKKEQEESA